MFIYLTIKEGVFLCICIHIRKAPALTRSFMLSYSRSSKHYLLHLNPACGPILFLYPLVERHRVIGISGVVQAGLGFLLAVKGIGQLANHNLVTLHIGVESSEGSFFNITGLMITSRRCPDWLSSHCRFSRSQVTNSGKVIFRGIFT
jgi:hypothetical protein